MAERSERMRAQRSPTSKRISKRGAWVGMLGAVRFALHYHLHAERPEGAAWSWNTFDQSFTSFFIHYLISFHSVIIHYHLQFLIIYKLLLVSVNMIFTLA